MHAPEAKGAHRRLQWRCCRNSSAPGAAHLLAVLLSTADLASRFHEAAHPAGVGRQTSAIRASPVVPAGLDRLALALRVGARRAARLSQEWRGYGEREQHCCRRYDESAMHSQSLGPIPWSDTVAQLPGSTGLEADWRTVPWAGGRGNG